MKTEIRQSFQRNTFTVEFEGHPFGLIGHDRLVSPHGRPGLQHAYRILEDLGRRQRGDALPSILHLELAELHAVIATTPAGTRIQVQLLPSWLAVLDGVPLETVWRYLVRHLVVVEASVDGPHPAWLALQSLDWTAAVAQEEAA